MKKYGNRELNTDSIIIFFKENLTKYQPNSLQIYRQTLSSYTKFRKIEIEWEMITRLIPIVQRKFFATTDQTELELLKSVRTRTSKKTNERDNLLLDFLFYTGVRVNELVNIKHCDYQNKSLKILGKGNKIRYILVPDFLTKYFNGSSDYLFTTRSGKKMLSIQVRKIIYKRTEKAGINKSISPHSFRRSFATNLYNKKGKLETIQKQLGHSSLDTTMAYIHNDHETLYQDYSKLWNNPPPPLHLPTSLKSKQK